MNIARVPVTKSDVIAVAWEWYDPSLVRINEDAISSLDLDLSGLHDGSMGRSALDRDWSADAAFAFALNAINYQFWDVKPESGFSRYAFEGLQGAVGMRHAFERAWRDSIGLFTKAKAGRPLTLEDIYTIFGDIPAPQGRVDILNEIFLPRGLNSNSPVYDLANEILNDAVSIQNFTTVHAHRMAEVFPLSFADHVLKKAQLAISEVWLQGKDRGFDYTCDLTAFADYQIPNVLRAMGVLDYSDALGKKIDRCEEIFEGSAEERAIRGASILAVEKIATIKGAPVASVDHYIWARRKEAKTPFHLTFTTAY